MLKNVAWANSLAATTVVFYLVLWLLSSLAPALFELVYNAQFLGADVASQYGEQDLTAVLTGLVIVAATGWLVGYVWAWLYNNWAK